MINVVHATKGQIMQMEKKYTHGVPESVNVHYDNEDEIFFIRVKYPTYLYEFQMKKGGGPRFIGLSKGESRYDISYPDPSSRLYTVFKEIADKYIKEWEDGNLL